jgi:hypothetical protein
MAQKNPINRERQALFFLLSYGTKLGMLALRKCPENNAFSFSIFPIGKKGGKVIYWTKTSSF